MRARVMRVSAYACIKVVRAFDRIGIVISFVHLVATYANLEWYHNKNDVENFVNWLSSATTCTNR